MPIYTFMPVSDGWTFKKNKSYFQRTGQQCVVVRQLKNGLYVIKFGDGHEMTVPKRHIEGLK